MARLAAAGVPPSVLRLVRAAHAADARGAGRRLDGAPHDQGRRGPRVVDQGRPHEAKPRGDAHRRHAPPAGHDRRGAPPGARLQRLGRPVDRGGDGPVPAGPHAQRVRADPRILHTSNCRRGDRRPRVPAARRTRRLRRRRAGLRAERRHRPARARDGPAALPRHRRTLQGDPLDRRRAVRGQRQDVRGDAARRRAVCHVHRAMDERARRALSGHVEPRPRQSAVWPARRVRAAGQASRLPGESLLRVFHAPLPGPAGPARPRRVRHSFRLSDRRTKPQAARAGLAAPPPRGRLPPPERDHDRQGPVPRRAQRRRRIGLARSRRRAQASRPRRRTSSSRAATSRSTPPTSSASRARRPTSPKRQPSRSACATT
jgi:hypothetical protein